MTRQTFGQWWPITFAAYDGEDRATLTDAMVDRWRIAVELAGRVPAPTDEVPMTVRYLDTRTIDDHPRMLDPSFDDEDIEVVALVEGLTQ